CAVGVGERVGNTPMELLLLNLKLMGVVDNDLSGLGDYVETVSRHYRVPLPHAWPALGRDAYRVTSQSSASRLLELLQLGERELMERQLSGVAPRLVGRDLDFAVGPQSGPANVEGLLARLGREASPQEREALLEQARTLRRAVEVT
ncbi:MAG: hypothetical protein AB1758_14180, partial [Candidatus Eremiobacterota bacterium]